MECVLNRAEGGLVVGTNSRIRDFKKCRKVASVFMTN